MKLRFQNRSGAFEKEISEAKAKEIGLDTAGVVTLKGTHYRFAFLQESVWVFLETTIISLDRSDIWS